MQRQNPTPEQVRLAKENRIEFPTLTPLFSTPPNSAAIQKWVGRHQQIDPALGELAQVFADNINHITFEQFLAQLNDTVADFNAQAKDEPYVLWIPQVRNYVLEDGCSDVWTAGLALEHSGLNWPVHIAETEKLADYLMQHPEIKQVLVLDDCGYSGQHITYQLGQLKMKFMLLDYDYSYLNVFIGIPFQSAEANQSFSDALECTTTILRHRPIKMVNEILSEEMLEFAESLDKYFSGNVTLTYFDHAMPDHKSTSTVLSKLPVSQLNKGFLAPVASIGDKSTWDRVVKEAIDCKERLVPVIVRPYRLHRKEYQTELDKALQENSMGKFTAVNIPERYMVVRQILQTHQLLKPEPDLNVTDNASNLFRLPWMPVMTGSQVVRLMGNNQKK